MANLGQYLIGALREQGVEHTFGVPGDFVIGLYDIFQRDGRIQPIVMTHEPGAGFAADAYARGKGLGVAMVTYCVGGPELREPCGWGICGKVAGAGGQWRPRHLRA